MDEPVARHCFALRFNRTPRSLERLREELMEAYGCHVPPPGYGLQKGVILAPGNVYFDILTAASILQRAGIPTTDEPNTKPADVPNLLKHDNLNWRIWIVDERLQDAVIKETRRLPSKDHAMSTHKLLATL